LSGVNAATVHAGLANFELYRSLSSFAFFRHGESEEYEVKIKKDDVKSAK
jgi:hypothetical protein